MKIPKDPMERQMFYADVLRQCTASRADRYQFNAMLKNYYLFGTKDTTGCYYNKIASTIDTMWNCISSHSRRVLSPRFFQYRRRRRKRFQLTPRTP